MNKYMNIAYNKSLEGMKSKSGGPFGAVIVNSDGEILAIAGNTVLSSNDPTAHAEINAIRMACEKLGTSDLSNCTIYTSCEPCPMCLSAIIWANIKDVYYACTRTDAASIGFRDDAIYEYLKGNRRELLNIQELDREECLIAMQEYREKGGKIY